MSVNPKDIKLPKGATLIQEPEPKIVLPKGATPVEQSYLSTGVKVYEIEKGVYSDAEGNRVNKDGTPYKK